MSMEKMINLSQKERVLLRGLESESLRVIVSKNNGGMRFNRKIGFSRSSKSEEKLEQNDQFL